MDLRCCGNCAHSFKPKDITKPIYCEIIHSHVDVYGGCPKHKYEEEPC